MIWLVVRLAISLELISEKLLDGSDDKSPPSKNIMWFQLSKFTALVSIEPVCTSNTQSPDRFLAPVSFNDAATSACVNCEKALINFDPASPAARSHP